MNLENGSSSASASPVEVFPTVAGCLEVEAPAVGTGGCSSSVSVWVPKNVFVLAKLAGVCAVDRAEDTLDNPPLLLILLRRCRGASHPSCP